MSLGLFNCRLIQPGGDQLFAYAPGDASCSAPTSGRAQNALAFPSQKDFVLVFSGREAPSGRQGVHSPFTRNFPRRSPILPINSATDPNFSHCGLATSILLNIVTLPLPL